MTAFNYGYTKRSTRRVYVLRGFDGCDPTTYTTTAPVTSGVTIKSGQVVSLTNGEWVLGCAAGKVPHIALSDSSDTDVSSSGLLPALSCAGKFEIQTPHYKGTLTGNDIPVAAVASAGTPTNSVVGDVTHATLSASGASALIGMTSRGGIVNLNSGTGPKREVNSDTPNVVTFITNWTPNAVTSVGA